MDKSKKTGGTVLARTDARFRISYNAVLDRLATAEVGAVLPSEASLSREQEVSRTVIRAVSARLEAEGLLRRGPGRDRRLLRAPTAADRLPELAESISLEELEQRFLDWILRFDVPADTPLNVAQLAKQFSVAPHLLQEFLATLSASGLVERRPRGGWRLLGFTSEFAIELSELRLLLETHAVRQLTQLPSGHAVWEALDTLEARHRNLLARVETDYHDFSRLDGQFHATITSVVQNRFFAQVQKVISLIFHYHYQWDKAQERNRNEAAINEHLTMIAAMRGGDPDAAAEAARAHLATSKETLLGSLRSHRLG